MEPRTLLASIVVNTALDENDPANATLSLREAIELTNGSLQKTELSTFAQGLVDGQPSTVAQDFISFAIPGIGVRTIALTAALPAITHPVNIEGYTQSGAVANDAVFTEIDRAALAVRLDGTNAGAGANGLTIHAANCLISGLEIVNFRGHGIEISGAGAQGNSLFGNFIGTSTVSPTNDRDFPTGLGNGASGVYITSSNNRVGGNTPGIRNVIFGNDVGVTLDGPGSTGNLIQGNFILDNDNQGVLVRASNNTIGEALKGGGNVISGNGAQGVKITGGPNNQGNQLLGNVIGADIGYQNGALIPIGLDRRPNGAEGVLIDNSPKNTVGSLLVDGRNVIAGNQADGILIQGDFSTNNRLLNNWIGFNIVTSLLALDIPNNLSGVRITSADNSIGDGSAAGRNVISENGRHGIELDGPGATRTRIQGNVIGLNPDGGSDFGNTFDGIHIRDSADNVIGGPNPGDRNTISGNNNGIVITNTGTLGLARATGNIVQGNFIGTAVDGKTDLGNAVDGVVVDDASRNKIGGAGAGEGNVISGNNRGVRLIGSGARDNLVQGNFIGTDLTGTVVIHNEVDGVLVTDEASKNTIGGLEPGAGNTIAFNVRNGVRIESGVDNAILSNRIHSNTKLGIDLVGGNEESATGVTANAPGSPHSGPNRLQNYPILTAVAPSGNATFVQGTFSAAPNTSYTIQFFSSPAEDLSGFGQGKVLLGTSTLTTDTSGNALFALNVPVAVPSGQFVTATATDPEGNTSEFSNSLPSEPVSIQFSNAVFSVGEGTASATITITRIGGLGGAVAVTFATRNGTATAGSDYAAISGPIFFNPTEVTKTVTIPISDDQQLEPNETILLRLTDPTNGATLGGPSTATLTIVDNEQSAVQFNAASYSVNEQAGTATVTVTRNSAVGALAVSYATSDGTARAGINYTPRSGQLLFSEGQTSRSFTIPILNDNQAGGDTVINLSLANPSAGILGAPSTATLTIKESGVSNPGGGVPNPGSDPSSNPGPNPDHNQPGPIVTDLRLVLGQGVVTGILLSFDRPLDLMRAQNMASYGFMLAAAGADAVLGTADDFTVPLASAVYNPATLQVVLTPALPLQLNMFYRLVVNGNPSNTAGVTDSGGNLLDGDANGVNGGVYVALFGVGNRFVYLDRNGDRVTLRLSRGGLMELQRAADGEARQLRLLSPVARRSVLNGSVKGMKGGDGRTSIGTLSGQAGVKLRLNRSIRLGRLSATSVAAPRGPHALGRMRS